MAYHDSCYLGRYNDIYDAPRETLKRALPVITLVDPPRSRDRGLVATSDKREWSEGEIRQTVTLWRLRWRA